MDPKVREWIELIFRWTHVVAGITWIGHLYFFNWVNAQVAKTYDADSKKKVVPELMPRALYFFRWGAVYTWITGILMLGLTYTMVSNTLVTAEAPVSEPWAATGSAVGCLVVAWFIYDIIWKAMAKKETVGVIVSFILLAALSFGYSRLFTPRATFILVGATFGTIMAANVWMRIWPNQRRIISATKAGNAPDPAWLGPAGLRSKHNTYMSVPLVFTMVANHYDAVYSLDVDGQPIGWVVLLGLIIFGWLITKLLYKKSAQTAPAKFEPAAAATTTPKAA